MCVRACVSVSYRPPAAYKHVKSIKKNPKAISFQQNKTLVPKQVYPHQHSDDLKKFSKKPRICPLDIQSQGFPQENAPSAAFRCLKLLRNRKM